MFEYLNSQLFPGWKLWQLILFGLVIAVYINSRWATRSTLYKRGLSMLPHVRAKQVEAMDNQTRQALQAQTIGHRIVCAANRYGTIVVAGVRHHDMLMNETIRLYKEHVGLDEEDKAEQGFVDNNGNFLSREEAWEVALVAGQILRRVGGDDRGRLFSDNMW